MKSRGEKKRLKAAQQLNVTEMDGAGFRRFFSSAQRRNANLKSRFFNELDGSILENGIRHNHQFLAAKARRSRGGFQA